MSDYNQNQYQQYGFDNYDESDQQPDYSPGFYSVVTGRFTSPGFATFFLLLLSGAVVWFAVYSGGQDENADLPIIKADASSYKARPADGGGMDVAHKDSTIFNSTRGASMSESAPVENLLAEAPVDRLKEFAEEAQSIMEDKPAPQNLLAEAGGTTETAQDTAKTALKIDPAPAEAVKPVDAAPAQAQQVANLEAAPTPAKKPDAPERPATLHAPGSSPDTLAFVRSALNQSAPEASAAAAPSPAPTPAADSASAVAAIEPAAGFASGEVRYYVQLSSITEQGRADAEWAKLQDKYPPMLDAKPHRVQRADLGERGTYFRIQAGPFEKEAASNLCTQIKSVNPNGCLVVQ